MNIIFELTNNFPNLYESEHFTIERKILRNSDMKEINLCYKNKPIIKFTLLYGFRNIQYILKNIKAKKEKFEYSFIEIMACPGGCLSGGI
jgi:iron only hydrogenase large subunit-like protein